jgi:hypothetical protein
MTKRIDWSKKGDKDFWERLGLENSDEKFSLEHLW